MRDHLMTDAEYQEQMDEPAPEGYDSSGLVPRVCADCDADTFYDDEDESYHHIEIGRECGLIQTGDVRTDEEQADLLIERGDQTRFARFVAYTLTNPCENPSTAGDACGYCAPCLMALEILHPEVTA